MSEDRNMQGWLFNAAWYVKCKYFVSENVPPEDGRLWSKRLKAGLN